MHEDNIESLWRKVMYTSADNCPMEFAKALAERAALAEREACALACEAEHVGIDVCDDCDNEADETYNRALRDGATAIRERSNAEISSARSASDGLPGYRADYDGET